MLHLLLSWTRTQLNVSCLGDHSVYEPHSHWRAVAACEGVVREYYYVCTMRAVVAVLTAVVAVLAAVIAVASHAAGADVGRTARGAGRVGAGVDAVERGINGTVIEDMADVPFVVALKVDMGVFCTGSMLDDDVVLTAAHCLEAIPQNSTYRSQLKVCAGSTDLDRSTGTCVGVKDMFISPEYDFQRIGDGNDVGIATLSESLAAHTAPVKLLFQQPEQGTKLVTVGYGISTFPSLNVTEEQETLGDDGVLYEVDHLVMPPEHCQFYFNQSSTDYEYPITRDTPNEELICVSGDYDGSQGASCHGDSGGPMLVRRGDQRMIQVGVVSISKLRTNLTDDSITIGCEFDDAEQVGMSLHAASVQDFIKTTMASINPAWNNYVDEPDAVEDQPDAAEEQPDAVEDQPDAVEEQPDAVEDQPDAAEDQPDADDSSQDPSNPRTEADEGRLACFPAAAAVQLIDGRTKLMHELHIGDVVLAAPHTYSHVVAFTHRDSTAVTKFVQLCGGGVCVEASASHYLYVSGRLVAADHVAVGDVLARGDGVDVRVESVRWVVRRGVYNPQTESGQIVVNDVVASTYTRALHPRVAHLLLWYVRAAYWCGVKDGVWGMLDRSVPRAVSWMLPGGAASVQM